MNEKEELLSQLRPVHIPDVSMLPAAGWWVLLAVLLTLGSLAFWLHKRYRANLWQREARQDILRIRAELGDKPASETLADTSRLARQLLLVARPREDVASLHGQEWLAALDEVCDRPQFVTGFGQLLESTQYQANPTVNESDMNSLLDAIEELINSTKRFKQ